VPGPALRSLRRAGPGCAARSCPLAPGFADQLAAGSLGAFPAFTHAVQLVRIPHGEECPGALEVHAFGQAGEVAQMFGQDEPPAGIERNFGEAEQLMLAHLAIEIAAQTQCPLFLAVDLVIKRLLARQAEASETFP